MKQTSTSLFSIKLLFLLMLPFISIQSMAQEQEIEVKAIQTDTVVFKQSYGLRIGGDIGKLGRSFLDENYTGFEIMGDYRLSKNLYLAGELGTEERTLITDNLDVTATGSYFKAGIDYNFYVNWLDMENMIYGGARSGFGTFKQTLNSFTVYTTDRYWGDPFSEASEREFEGLSAIWLELIVGIKAELFANLYMGLNVQIKGLVTENEPDGFENLYIPGFNRTFDSGRFGIGFGYNLSYLIPIYKKDKKVQVETVERDTPTDGN